MSRILLSFLAARYPAAYPIFPIADRINRSGIVDHPMSTDDVQRELLGLATRGLARHDIDPLDGVAVWSATPEGLQAWNRDGRPFGG